jgi:hypothetical protein
MVSAADAAYGRVARLTIEQLTPVAKTGTSWFQAGFNSIQIEGLRLSFQVVRDPTAAPNTATVNVHNLAPGTRAALRTRPLRAVLETGYRGDVGMTFAGDVREVLTSRSAGVVVTTLELGDGERAWRGATMTRSYRGGTPAISVIRDLAAAAGLNLPRATLNDPALRAQLAGGYAGDGGALQQLEEVLGSLGYGALVHDGKLEIHRDDEVLPGQALLVDADHGLIGQPVVAARRLGGGVSFNKILDRRLRPRQLAQISSQDFSGLVRCVKVRHAGDTSVGPWQTSVEARIHRG